MGKPIIPLLAGSIRKVPAAEALPRDLKALASHQCCSLRDETWDDDVDRLVRVLARKHGFRESDDRAVLPVPRIEIAPLEESQLDEGLKTLPDWEPVESFIPGDYPNLRHELRRVFRFKSFKDAMQFMAEAQPPIREMQHHPRWENQWRTVTVHLSTWDIGQRISQLDVELATRLDTLYEKYKK
jgi:pterin-4a-carbinolamine dehydratase